MTCASDVVAVKIAFPEFSFSSASGAFTRVFTDNFVEAQRLTKVTNNSSDTI